MAAFTSPIMTESATFTERRSRDSSPMKNSSISPPSAYETTSHPVVVIPSSLDARQGDHKETARTRKGVLKDGGRTEPK
ncbi:Os04g0521650 [Oryza sativa Japonica Group]|uniref:Os04g0521650 protein n=1 Tax=Oryza sativa subsp. japonica TaxID=39947 RepID=A0A0P0WCI0_ORYSJ|nr:Os04g0521650 [Oryza sativa Japonica Group]